MDFGGFMDRTRTGGMSIKFFQRAFSGLFLCILAVTAMQPHALADEADQWRVAAISGRPYVSNTGIVPVSRSPEEVAEEADALKIGDVLQPGMWVVTPDNARALLVRGNETIIVAPGSRMGLPVVAQDGLSTTILHSLGSLLLSVDRKTNPHFQVITPFLTAVVKGTTFTTTVEDQRSKVHVFEGSVKVSDAKDESEYPEVPTDLAVMFVDEDPDAGFDIFVLNGPTGPTSIIDPVEIKETATILPLGSELTLESGQTAGIALDGENPRRRSIDPLIDPNNDGTDGGPGLDPIPGGPGSPPPNRSLGEDRDDGNSRDPASNDNTFIAGGGNTGSSSGGQNTFTRNPGNNGNIGLAPPTGSAGGGTSGSGTSTNDGHGGRGF
jgi:hypothetical protein